MTDLLKIHHLGVRLGERWVLEDVSLSIAPGEVVVLIGPNGSGKTTLLRATLGLIPHQGGEILVFGKPPERLTRSDRERIGYVPQSLSFDRSQPLLVSELLACLAPANERSLTALQAILHRVDAEHLLNQPLRLLSGGELQRVVIAAALIREPQLLLLDEPGTGIDVSTRLQFYDLIESLRSEKGVGALIVSHDLSVVSRYAGRVVCIHHRLICTGTPQEVLSTPVLEQLYGHPVAVYNHQHEGEG